MKKLLAAALIVFAGFSSPAHAALIDVTLGSTSTESYGSGGALAPNVNLLSLGSNLSLNGAVIINPASSFPGLYAQPTGSLYGGNYLAVFGGSATGTATIAVAPGVSTFGFTWGTVDDYNSLILTDSRNVTYTITGADILSHIIGSVAGTSQSDVSFYDPYGTIVSAELTSTQNSFEAGNFQEKVSAVPLPGALPLFGLALVGLVFVARRKMMTKSI